MPGPQPHSARSLYPCVILSRNARLCRAQCRGVASRSEDVEPTPAPALGIVQLRPRPRCLSMRPASAALSFHLRHHWPSFPTRFQCLILRLSLTKSCIRRKSEFSRSRTHKTPSPHPPIPHPPSSCPYPGLRKSRQQSLSQASHFARPAVS